MSVSEIESVDKSLDTANQTSEGPFNCVLMVKTDAKTPYGVKL